MRSRDPVRRPRQTLIITGLFPPQIGGVSQVLFQIASELAPEVSVLTAPFPHSAGFDRQCSFPVHRPLLRSPVLRRGHRMLGAFSPLLAYTARQIGPALRIVRTAGVGIVVCGQLRDALLGFLIRLVTRCPFVISINGDEALAPALEHLPVHRRCFLGLRHVLGLALKRFLIRRADAIIVNSSYTRRKVIQRLVQREDIRLLHPATDPAPAAEPPGVDAVRRALELGHRRVILGVGTLVWLKGHDSVIRAMPLVLSRVPSAVYVVIGGGPERRRLEALVDELGLGEHVRLVGPLPHEELAPYFHLSEVFVLTSRELPDTGAAEGFGIVFLEANAWGKPVVGGRSGGVPDAVVDGVTGLLVDPESPPEIAEALIRILSQPDLARRLGRAGRERVEHEMNCTHAGRRVQTLLDEIRPRTSGSREEAP